MTKVIFIVCDGLGDRPVRQLGGKTPLEAASTPNLDQLAKEGICGLVHTVDIGIRPGSDTSHLALFGYDPKIYYTGRGPFETAGIDMEMKPGDICFRANMGTVDEKMIVIDRRAGRIDDTSEFADLFNGMVIDGATFLLKKGTGHRVGLIIRGKGLSSRIIDADPHEIGEKIHQVKSTDGSKEAEFTAEVLNKFLKTTHEKLKDLPSNKEREKAGELPANFILVRGAGVFPRVPSFKEKYGLKAVCLAGAGLYKGIGKILGMVTPNIEGATGKPDSNLKVKIAELKKLYDKFDFFFIHFKGADTLGEDGNCQAKKEFIEKIDQAIEPLLDLKDTLIVVTADHSTPCELKAHSADPVPVLIWGRQVRTDKVVSFGERDCIQGGLGQVKGLNIMPIVIDLLGQAQLYGA